MKNKLISENESQNLIKLMQYNESLVRIKLYQRNESKLMIKLTNMNESLNQIKLYKYNENPLSHNSLGGFYFLLILRSYIIIDYNNWK